MVTSQVDIQNKNIGLNIIVRAIALYFSNTGAIKAEYNFCFVNNGYSGLKKEKISNGKSQSSPKPTESSSKILKAPNSISSTLASLSNIVPDPTIVNEKPNNAIHDYKANDLPKASVIPVGRPKCILNPSLKVYKVLKGKAIILVEDLDQAEVYVFAAEIKKIKVLEPSNLKEAMR